MRFIRCYTSIFLLVTLCVLTQGASVPLWDMYKWGSNYLAWCRFRCDQKISAGNIFKIDLSGVTSKFKEFGNLKFLSKKGTSYIVENNYDIWGDGTYCQFQFGLTFTGTNLNGNCSSYQPPPSSAVVVARKPIKPATQSRGITKQSRGITKQSRGITKQSQSRGITKQPRGITKQPSGITKQPRGMDLAMWANNIEGNMFRYKGRCTTSCSGTYQPGTLRIRIEVDKDTTNFNGFKRFSSTIPTNSLARSWTVVNKGVVSSTLGLCNIDFQVEHQGEFPLPKGSCYVI